MDSAEVFQFERDFMEDGMRCIPMAARLRLDLCGIKLRLSEWSKMTQAERKQIATWPYDKTAEVDRCREYVRSIVVDRTGREATELPGDRQWPWADTSHVAEAVAIKMSEFNWTLSCGEWQSFTELQRFALVKLTRQGHENRNFPLAIMEFRKVQSVPVI